MLFALLSFTAFTRADTLTTSTTLAWDPNPETDIVGYRVLYGTTSGALSLSQTVSGNTHTATINELEIGETYYFAVLAYNSSGVEGPPSEEVAYFVEPPSAPEISIDLSPSTALISGQNDTFFGELKIGTTSQITEFVIRNTGTAPLSGLMMEIDGPDHQNFSVLTELPFTPILTSNAAFDAKLSAWTTTGNLRIIRDDSSPGRGNVVDFNFSNTTPNGSISQSFSTTPGTSYTLTFDVGILSFNSNPQAILAAVSGSKPLISERVSLAGSGSRSTDWNSYNFTFIADSSNTQLTLTDVSPSTEGADIRIDNVRVIDAARAVDQPTALTLFPGESSSFLVAFSPSSPKAKAAYLHILSNDVDEKQFDLTLSGSGLDYPEPPAQPEIEIKSSVGNNLVNGAATISFLDTLLSSSTESETLIITNTGTSDLSDLSVTISGANPNDFPIQPLAAKILAPGESTAFQINFKPKTLGSKSSTLEISSNDEDEPKFKIALSGNGTHPSPDPKPEITVERSNNANLNSLDAINFGGILPGATSFSEIITIQNTGTAELSNLAHFVVGNHASDYVIGATATNSLAPGSSTSFTVFFKPTTSGIRNATIRITSNDADENPFEIALVGNGIAVPEINIEKSNGNNLTHASSSIEFPNVILGSTSASEVLTIRNSGTASLTNLAASVSGNHASDFILISPPVSSLLPGSTTPVKISFKPTASGTRSAILRIASNDADENPFEIALVGNGVAVPKISLFRADGRPLTDGSNTLSFGKVDLGSFSTAEIITIQNTGSAPLTDLAIFTSNGANTDFIISPLESTSLAAGSRISVSVSFNPQAAGVRSSLLQITSNDPASPNLAVVLNGQGGSYPVIALAHSDGTKLDPGTTLFDLGSVLLGATGSQNSLRIKNIGTAVLSGLSISCTGPNNNEFIITQPAVAALEPGAEAWFNVTFKPVSGGRKSAILRISNDHSPTAPLDLNIVGNANTIPAISLFDSDGSDLSSGTAAVNFGNLDILATPKSRTFTIRSTGTAALTGIRILKEGSNAADFSITTNGLDNIAPGESATFTIKFNPAATGQRTCAIRILSNAGYDIVEPLTGKGTSAPEIQIEVANKNLKTGESFINFGNTQISGRTETRVITISNVGSANLERITLTRNGTASGDFTVGALKTNTLAPGKSTTFNISFKPSQSGNRWAGVNISSNDADEKPFSIGLSGFGSNRNNSQQNTSRAPKSHRTYELRSDQGIEVIDGKKYRSLTIHKSSISQISSHDIEVSSDLTHWSSGPSHTTVVRDNPSLITIRDKTPYGPESKRHIRLRP